MSTNCLGPFLFTSYLTPLLQKTAASSPPGSVRVTWAASLATLGSPKQGVAWDDKTGGPKIHNNRGLDYAQSKSANVLLAREYQARYGKDGIVSNAWNPGNLSSELQRHQNWLAGFLTKGLLYPAIFGAYTELFAGWSDDAAKDDRKGAYIGPWGRFVGLRKDVDESPHGKRFWEWCETETISYVS